MAQTYIARTPFRGGVKWKFKTKRFLVQLIIERIHNYKYDGDDPDGEVQAKLESGEYVAFDSRVEVSLHSDYEIGGETLGSDHLGGNVYGRNDAHDFWTEHRSADPDNRNTLAMKAQNKVICHYFPEMVRTACSEAREYINMYPKMRREG